MVDGFMVGLGSAQFGITAQQCIEDARRAADLGFDVFELTDHLGMNAPLATLAGVAAAVTKETGAV